MVREKERERERESIEHLQLRFKSWSGQQNPWCIYGDKKKERERRNKERGKQDWNMWNRQWNEIAVKEKEQVPKTILSVSAKGTEACVADCSLVCRNKMQIPTCLNIVMQDTQKSKY